MSVLIGHIAVDKNGIATGGSSAAQSTDTIFTRTFYDKQWHSVYRPNNDKKAEIIATTMQKICENDNIQYSEEDRLGLYSQAQLHHWDVSKITEPCGADSVTMLFVIVRALGEVLGNEKTLKFENLDWFLTRAGLQKLKFQGKEYLKRGDIILSDTHVAVVLSDGDKIDRRTPAQQVMDMVAKNQSLIGEGISSAITKTSISVYSGPGIHFIEYKVIPKNTELAILEVLTNGWFKIVYPYVQAGYGYIQDLSGTALNIADKSILPSKEEEEEIISTPVNYQVHIMDSVVNIRKGPGKEYPVAGNVNRWNKYTIIKECNGWGYLSTGNGWINLSKTHKI